MITLKRDQFTQIGSPVSRKSGIRQISIVFLYQVYVFAFVWQNPPSSAKKMRKQEKSPKSLADFGLIVSKTELCDVIFCKIVVLRRNGPQLEQHLQDVEHLMQDQGREASPH